MIKIHTKEKHVNLTSVLNVTQIFLSKKIHIQMISTKIILLINKECLHKALLFKIQIYMSVDNRNKIGNKVTQILIKISLDQIHNIIKDN